MIYGVPYFPEVETLLGDPTKAKEKLGWEPKISFADLVAEMVRADLEDAKRDELCKKPKGGQIFIVDKIVEVEDWLFRLWHFSVSYLWYGQKSHPARVDGG